MKDKLVRDVIQELLPQDMDDQVIVALELPTGEIKFYPIEFISVSNPVMINVSETNGMKIKLGA